MREEQNHNNDKGIEEKINDIQNVNVKTKKSFYQHDCIALCNVVKKYGNALEVLKTQC